MALKMNRNQQRARIRLLEMKKASELPIIEVSSLPTTGSFDVIYLYNDDLYTWNGTGYDNLIPTDINELSDEDGLLKTDINQLTDEDTLLKMEDDNFTDWFLPSSGEVAEMYTNLHAEGVGSFDNAAAYLTSSEKSATDAHLIQMSDGGQAFSGKDEARPVRPARKFTSENIYSLRDTGPAGGLIFYIDDSGEEPVYYEAASADIADAAWSNIVNAEIGTTGVGIGDGATNTAAIIAQTGHTASGAKDCLDFSVVFDDRIRPKNGKLIRREYIDGIIEEQIGEDVVVTTHSELVALRDASELIVGKNYLISDFAQSYNIFDGGTMNIIEEQIGAAEPIIVTASKVNELYKVAISTVYPQDIIHYSLDILDIRDIGFGNGVDTVNANFKGQIYYRKDTIQNVETHYDFRNVKFRRWAVDAVDYDNGAAYVAKDICKSGVDGKIYKCITATTGEGDPTVNTADWVLWLDITADAFVSWTADKSNKTKFNIGDITTDNLIINNVTAGADYDDFYTFGDYYKWVHDVSLGGINLDYIINYYGSVTILLSQKVFKTTNNLSTCFSIKFGDNNLPMTFGDSNYSMAFGNYNSSMAFGNYNNSMTFGDGNYSMTFGNGNYSMTFGNGNNSMTFGDGNNSMTFGNYNNSMTFGNGNYSMTFGNGNNSMTFGDGNYSMAFGDNTNNENRMIIFGNNNTMCVFEAKCFIGSAADLDLSAATHIRGAYNTTIYQDAADGVKLSYMDGGVMQIVDVTA